MKELILELSAKEPYAFPWDRTLKQQNLDVSKQEVIDCLRDLGLNNFDARKEFAWNLELAIYECAAKYSSINEIIKNIKLKLAKFKVLYPYINEEITLDLLANKKLDKEENIDIFKKVLKNTLSNSEKEIYSKEISLWIIEIIASKIMLNDIKDINIIKAELFNTLSNNYDYLNIDSDNLSRRLRNLGIGLGKNIELFISKMKDEKERYEGIFNTTDINVEIKNNTSLEEKKEEDLTESILGLFESIEEKEEIEEEKLQCKKEEIQDVSAVEEASVEEEEPKEEVNSEEVYKHLSALAKSLGYQLLDKQNVQVSREYYENNNASRNEEEKVIKQLISLEKGAVLSQLYNTYKNLSYTSLDNIEAVMSNFFSALFAIGFEVNEDDEKVGEKIKVDTKNLFKEFLFLKPVNRDGEMFGQVEYLSWNYKDKMIMPKIVKPLE